MGVENEKVLAGAGAAAIVLILVVFVGNFRFLFLPNVFVKKEKLLFNFALQTPKLKFLFGKSG